MTCRLQRRWSSCTITNQRIRQPAARIQGAGNQLFPPWTWQHEYRDDIATRAVNRSGDAQCAENVLPVAEGITPLAHTLQFIDIFGNIRYRTLGVARLRTLGVARQPVFSDHTLDLLGRKLGEKHLAPGSEIPGAAHALGRVNTEVVRTLDTLDNNHIVAVLEPNRYGSLGFSRQFFS